MLSDFEFMPRATTDLRTAFRWYLTKSPRVADRFLNSVDETISRIRAFPNSFARRDSEHRFAKIKKYPYLILFRVRPGFVLIVGVGHSKRSEKYWKNRAR